MALLGDGKIAVFEGGFGVAEDEIDVAGDLAIRKVLAHGNPVLPVVRAVIWPPATPPTSPGRFSWLMGDFLRAA